MQPSYGNYRLENTQATYPQQQRQRQRQDIGFEALNRAVYPPYQPAANRVEEAYRDKPSKYNNGFSDFPQLFNGRRTVCLNKSQAKAEVLQAERELSSAKHDLDCAKKEFKKALSEYDFSYYDGICSAERDVSDLNNALDKKDDVCRILLEAKAKKAYAKANLNLHKKLEKKSGDGEKKLKDLQKMVMEVRSKVDGISRLPKQPDVKDSVEEIDEYQKQQGKIKQECKSYVAKLEGLFKSVAQLEMACFVDGNELLKEISGIKRIVTKELEEIRRSKGALENLRKAAVKRKDNKKLRHRLEQEDEFLKAREPVESSPFRGHSAAG